jgi:phosphomannomutase / phosphoglucomutase
VVDVKSTGLFLTDPVLQGQRRQGRLLEDRPFLHQAPQSPRSARSRASRNRATSSSTRRVGRGYDDGLISALAICDMLDRNPGRKCRTCARRPAAHLGSPTMSPHCDDEKKYGVVEKVVKHFERLAGRSEKVAGQNIRELITVNGVRVVLADGTWGLVRRRRTSRNW